MSKVLARLFKEEEGQAMIEYALLVAVLVGITGGLSAFFITYVKVVLKRIYYTLLVPIL